MWKLYWFIKVKKKEEVQEQTDKRIGTLWNQPFL